MYYNIWNKSVFVMHEMSQQGDNIKYTTDRHFMYDPVILGHQMHEQLSHFVAIHKCVLSPPVIASVPAATAGTLQGG